MAAAADTRPMPSGVDSSRPRGRFFSAAIASPNAAKVLTLIDPETELPLLVGTLDAPVLPGAPAATRVLVDDATTTP